jgi:hypothetical protein
MSNITITDKTAAAYRNRRAAEIWRASAGVCRVMQ